MAGFRLTVQRAHPIPVPLAENSPGQRSLPSLHPGFAHGEQDGHLENWETTSADSKKNEAITWPRCRCGKHLSSKKQAASSSLTCWESQGSTVQRASWGAHPAHHPLNDTAQGTGPQTRLSIRLCASYSACPIEGSETPAPPRAARPPHPCLVNVAPSQATGWLSTTSVLTSGCCSLSLKEMPDL